MNAIRPLIDLLHEQEDLKGPETPEERFEGDDPRESPNSAETQARARVVMRRLVAQGLQMPPPDEPHELQHQATLAVLSQPVIADRIIGRMFERAAKAWEDANNHGKVDDVYYRYLRDQSTWYAAAARVLWPMDIGFDLPGLYPTYGPRNGPMTEHGLVWMLKDRRTKLLSDPDTDRRLVRDIMRTMIPNEPSQLESSRRRRGCRTLMESNWVDDAGRQVVNALRDVGIFGAVFGLNAAVHAYHLAIPDGGTYWVTDRIRYENGDWMLKLSDKLTGEIDKEVGGVWTDDGILQMKELLAMMLRDKETGPSVRARLTRRLIPDD